ncbi:transketolase [Candidatus Magnetaquicoccus inordinatus]|uniref:transketolase n=1 Tax=Candidatus Magnetaquicoccus inordinatus TaxID=2496818 RepID=UPI00187D2690|nr:transketolase [Candidatus Magnetaquicoccus inordinatus]
MDPHLSLQLRQRSRWLREQTLLLHKRAPGIRIASSLSPVEFLLTLYYGGWLQHDPLQPRWPERDRLILSKGHGSLAIYPILAERGYFAAAELETIATPHSLLGVIPDAAIPGIETTNGALGHGLGVATGMALALRHQQNPAQITVLCGDGEMNEGSIWEAVMLAAFHRLGNLLLVVDMNRLSMLGFQEDILHLQPLAEKLSVFGWQCQSCDGHDPLAIHDCLAKIWRRPQQAPQALLLHTVKGKGVASLENQELCHVLSLTPEQVDAAIAALAQEELP